MLKGFWVIICLKTVLVHFAFCWRTQETGQVNRILGHTRKSLLNSDTHFRNLCKELTETAVISYYVRCNAHLSHMMAVRFIYWQYELDRSA